MQTYCRIRINFNHIHEPILNIIIFTQIANRFINLHITLNKRYSNKHNKDVAIYKIISVTSVGFI